MSHRFFWFLDTFIISAAYLISYYSFPGVQRMFTNGSVFVNIWVMFLPPPASWGLHLAPLSEYLWVFFIINIVTILVMEFIGGHNLLSNQSRTRIIINSFLSPLVGMSIITLILFAIKNQGWSRLFIFSFTVLGSIGLSISFLTLRYYFRYRRARGYHAKNILIIGQHGAIAWAEKYFKEQVPKEDYRLIGYLDVNASSDADENQVIVERINDLENKGGVGKLGGLLINFPIDEVIAVYSAANIDWVSQVINPCDHLGVLLRIVPEALISFEMENLRALYPSEPLHLPAVVLAPRNWNTDALYIKRLFDIIISSILLIILSPLFGLVALAIKLSSPELPVFYPWKVIGQNGAEFIGYKFTTMVADAEKQKADLESINEMTGPVFKIAKDPRITPLGRFLRKFSINELPQLWSVLKGDMSLVGPRPAARHELERYEFWQKRKLSIKPGITCLWQIRGRNKIKNFNEWVKMDLEYIDHWSLWLDILILVRTVWVVLAGTGS